MLPYGNHCIPRCHQVTAGERVVDEGAGDLLGRRSPDGRSGAPSPAGVEAAFATGGKLGALVRSFDWAATPLGPVAGWPQSLVSSLSILLASKAQIVMFWGPDHFAFYNDAYAPTIGDKHPHALGRPAREYWAEMWDALEPLLDGVRETGTAFAASDYPFVINRHGFLEEVFFDISYDPVRVEDGSVGGVFCIVSETTRRVLTERRLRALHAIDMSTTAATKADAVVAGVVAELERLRHDLPWAQLHLCDPGDQHWRTYDTGTRPPDVVTDDVVRRALATQQPSDVVAGDVSVAVALPMSSANRLIGVVVLGVNPAHRLDLAYRGFLASIAARTATALANAQLLESEHHIAATLQRAILPARLPQPSRARLAARYLPAMIGGEVGGDWYDAFFLPDGRLALAIGDVVGKGVPAAASMGQLRNAARAYLLDGLGPAAALTRLGRFAALLDEQDFATALCAVVDLDDGRIEWSSAGHLPPLLIDGSGHRFLRDEPGVPVGMGELIDDGYRSCFDTLPEQAMLVLYTDGLVEDRAADIDVGMTQLATTAAGCARSVHDVVEALAALQAERRSDDVAVLALQRL